MTLMLIETCVALRMRKHPILAKLYFAVSLLPVVLVDGVLLLLCEANRGAVFGLKAAPCARHLHSVPLTPGQPCEHCGHLDPKRPAFAECTHCGGLTHPPCPECDARVPNPLRAFWSR